MPVIRVRHNTLYEAIRGGLPLPATDFIVSHVGEEKVAATYRISHVTFTPQSLPGEVLGKLYKSQVGVSLLWIISPFNSLETDAHIVLVDEKLRWDRRSLNRCFWGCEFPTHLVDVYLL